MHDKNWTIFSMADIFDEKVHYGLIFLLEKIYVFISDCSHIVKLMKVLPSQVFLVFFSILL